MCFLHIEYTFIALAFGISEFKDFYKSFKGLSLETLTSVLQAVGMTINFKLVNK